MPFINPLRSMWIRPTGFRPPLKPVIPEKAVIFSPCRRSRPKSARKTPFQAAALSLFSISGHPPGILPERGMISFFRMRPFSGIRTGFPPMRPDFSEVCYAADLVPTAGNIFKKRRFRLMAGSGVHLPDKSMVKKCHIQPTGPDMAYFLCLTH